MIKLHHEKILAGFCDHRQRILYLPIEFYLVAISESVKFINNLFSLECRPGKTTGFRKL